MSLLPWDCMDNDELAKRIFESGEYLITIEYYNQKINLYAVDEDFYEIYYDSKSNEVVEINLAMGNDMDKYVNKIDIGRFKT